MDLISGFPGQKQGEVAEDVERTLASAPSHVSLYALTLERGASDIRIPPDADELWLEGAARLEAGGYQAYEVSNFAPPGSECRHNLRYWRLEPYLGVGPAAVSTVPDGRGGVLRVENTGSLPEYLACADPIGAASFESVSPRDLLFDTLIMGLRLREGLAESAFLRRFGAPFASLLPRSWESWARRSLLCPSPGRIALSPPARLLLDSLLLEAREEIDSLREGAIRPVWP